MVNVERANGNWEAKFTELTYGEVQEIAKDNNIKEISLYKNIGVTKEDFGKDRICGKV